MKKKLCLPTYPIFWDVSGNKQSFFGLIVDDIDSEGTQPPTDSQLPVPSPPEGEAPGSPDLFDSPKSPNQKDQPKQQVCIYKCLKK